MTAPTKTRYTKFEIIELPPGDIQPDPKNPRTPRQAACAPAGEAHRGRWSGEGSRTRSMNQGI
jgi:hypothetical protein